MKTGYLQPDNYELLREIGNLWLSECIDQFFGVSVDMDIIISDLVKSGTSIIILEDETGIHGFFALFAVDSFLGSQKIAIEKYFYIEKEFRNYTSQLLSQAENWAKENGCSHLILTATQIGTERHDKLCILFTHYNFKHLETNFIKEIKR